MMEGTRLTGLWKNKDKNGKTYLSGSLGLARLLVLPNVEARPVCLDCEREAMHYQEAI